MFLPYTTHRNEATTGYNSNYWVTNFEKIRERVHFRRRDNTYSKLWDLAMKRAVEWAKEAGVRAVVGDQEGNGGEEGNEEQQQDSEDENYGKYQWPA